MNKSTYSINFGKRGKEFYPVSGIGGFSEDGASFTINLHLQPDHEYEFIIADVSFKSADGYPLNPFEVKFRTRKKLKSRLKKLNNLMFYNHILSKILAPYIEQIWYCKEVIETTRTVTVLPFTRIEMVINLSGKYTIGDTNYREGSGWIAGHQSRPYTSCVEGEHECIGVVFSIAGLNAFTRCGSSDFLNSFFELDNIFGEKINRLLIQTAEAKTPAAKCQQIENFLIDHHVENKVPDLLKNALMRIDQCDRKVTVNYLVNELNTTRKSLNVHFNRYLGISVSGYLQQLLFNRILKHLTILPGERLIETAYLFPFFDQAHFIRQFKGYAGMTPSAYKRLVKQKNVVKEQPNFVTA